MTDVELTVPGVPSAPGEDPSDDVARAVAQALEEADIDHAGRIEAEST